MVLHLLAQRGYGVANVDPTDPANLVSAIATTTDLEPDFILSVASPLIQRSVFRNRGMSQDFRVAMSHLCIEALSGDFIDSDSHPILAWLTGEQRGISGVRPFSIHTAITRTNARHFTESLFHKVGYTGTAIIDDSRVTLPANPKDGKVFYTRAMVMDHYELLRELIDSTDRLDGMFMSVLAGQEFDNPDFSRKGYAVYAALRARIANDVSGRDRPNPLAAMVRIGSPDTDGKTQ